MEETELNLGDWVFKLEKKMNYYHMGRVFYKGEEVDCKGATITLTPRSLVVVSVEVVAKGGEE